MKLTKHYHKHYMYSCLSDTVAVVFFFFLHFLENYPKKWKSVYILAIYEAILSSKKYWNLSTNLPDHQGTSLLLSSTWAGQGPQSYCPTPAPLWWSLTLAGNPQVCLKRPSPTYPCAEVKKKPQKTQRIFQSCQTLTRLCTYRCVASFSGLHRLDCLLTDMWMLTLAHTKEELVHLVVVPKQKHLVQPLGFIGSRSKLPDSHLSQSGAATFS